MTPAQLDATFAALRLFRKRIANKLARTDDELGQFQLLRFAGQLFCRIPSSAKRWLPIRITLAFFLQKFSRRFPISDGQVVNALKPEILRRGEGGPSAILIGVDATKIGTISTFVKRAGHFAIKASPNLINTRPTGFVSR